MPSRLSGPLALGLSPPRPLFRLSHGDSWELGSNCSYPAIPEKRGLLLPA